MAVAGIGVIPFRSVAIAGVGLLGGSLGLAMKQRGAARRVIGIGHRQSSLDKALALGAIDEATLDIREGVAEAELTILATPVGVMTDLVKTAKESFPRGAILTDVGSTKAELARTIEELAGDSVHYVGSHPMAGSEKHGVEQADAGLFDNALCFITPTSHTQPNALAVVTEFWQALGAHVRISAPPEHDRLVAQASHLPHVVAAMLVNVTTPDAMACIGKGFRDTTRVASGNPRMWADVCLQNRDRILEALRSFSHEIRTVSDIIDRKAEAELLAWLEAAKAVRDHHVQA